VNPRISAGAGEIGLIAKIAARDDDAAQRIHRKHRRFDQGWDKLREETFARQKALGVIPADAELTPRNEAFPAWNDVPPHLKPFCARQIEVYAGFSENAGYTVGRGAMEPAGPLGGELRTSTSTAPGSIVTFTSASADGACFTMLVSAS